MNNEIRERYLKLALVVSGIAFLLIYPLGLVWPSGWVMVARVATICR